MKRPLPDVLKAEILDNVPVIIAFHDQDQKVVWGNHAYQKAIGLSLQEIEGRRCHSVWGLAKPCRRCPVAQAIETGEPSEAELPPEHQEGGPVTQGAWLSKAVPLKDEDGNLIGVVETVHDITEHKRVEQVRHESEQRYRTLFETMAQGVVYQTAEGYISAANPAAERILGLSLDQMRGKTSMDPAWQSIHEDGSPFPGADHPSMVALRTGEPVAGVVMGVYHPHSGEHRWLMIDAVPEFLPGERKPHSVYTTFTDITERKRAEERYQTLFEHMLDGFALHEILCDARGQPVDYRFLAVNPAFERLTGLKAKAIVGKTVLEVLPSTEPHWIEIYGRVALTGEPAAFENYARDLDKYFQVTAFRPAPRQFACLFADITVHKRAEEEIRQFRTITDKATYGAALTGLDGHLTYVNETFAHMHGWEPADLLGRHLSVFHNEEQIARVEELLARLVREGEFATEEVWHQKRDGSVFPTLMNASLIRDAAGNPRFLSATALDITVRKQAEDVLWKTQNSLAEAQKIAHLGSFEYDVATQQTVWSDEEYRIYGLEPAGPSPVYDVMLAQCIHPDDVALLHQTFTTAMQSVSVYELEHRIVRPDGSVRWIYNRAHPYFDAEGTLVRYIGTTLDITERKHDEERLRRSEERLRLATDGAELGIWYWDMSTGTLEWSDRCKRHLGLLPGKEPSFEHFYAVMHPDDRDRIERLLAQAVENRSDYMADYRVTWPDGSLHWISAPGRVYCAANGDLIGMGGVTLDITARKQAEAEQEKLQAQLAQAQKLESIGRLAGGVAHDFNNMLGVILGHVELALERVDAAQPLHADLKAIQRGAERAADLTRQLLAFARKQIVVPRVLDLNDTVAGLLQMLRRLIGEDISLAWLPGADLWPVKLDPSQVDQILINLVVNARQAIAGVGQIAIETGNVTFDEAYCRDHAGFVPGEYVQLAVSDDGCGMDRETLAHLFEPFFTTKGVGQGTGLGLATLYGAVKQNQGFINVYSEPGQGTSFKIYLPRYRDEVAQVPIAVPAEPVRRGHETVLLVEDEPTLLNLIRRMLEKLGYRVLTAGTPAEALRRAAEHAGEIHLLVTDVVMPEMNGRDLAKQLVSLHPNLNCLFMSGYAASVIAPHGVPEGGVPFIQKPFSMKDLAAKIRKALEREP